MSDQTRLSVLMNEHVENFLRDYMARHGISATVSVARAFSLLEVYEEARTAGQKVQVCRGDGHPLYEVILP